MEKLSVRKLSALSLVLLAASAVAAAVIPSNKKELAMFADFSLTGSNDGDGASCASTNGTVTTFCTNTDSGSFFQPSRSTANWFNGSHSNQTSD